MTNFEEVFVLTGHGIFNNVVLVTCGLVLLYVNMELLGIGYIITSATCDLNLDDSERGLISSAGFIGVVSTAIFWGYLSVRFGRRRVMLPSLILSSLVSITSSMSPSFGMFFTLRLITGCLVSASSATVYAYLGELHTVSKRASAIAWCSAFIAITFLWVPGLAWVIIPGTWSFNLGNFRIVPWRLFLWTWAMPGVLAAALLVMLPESPRYLMATHKPDQALLVMAKMYAWNRKGNVSDFPVKTLASTTIPSGGFLVAFKNMAHLFRPPLLRCVIISHLCMFVTFLLSNSLYLWMPDILNTVVPHLNQLKSICELMTLKGNTHENKYLTMDLTEGCNAEINTQIYPVGIVMGLLCGATYLSVGFLVGRFCKRRLFMFIIIVCGLMLGAAGVVPQPHVAIVLYVLGLCSGCGASVLAAVGVEVFPTNVRALALCTLYMSGRLGAAVGATILSIGMHTHCVITILSMSLGTVGITLLMLLWPDPVKVRSEIESRGFVY